MTMLTPAETSTSIPQRTIDLCRSVFQNVWNEFYAWEHVYCETTIQNLVRAGTLHDMQDNTVADLSKPFAKRMDSDSESHIIKHDTITCWAYKNGSSSLNIREVDIDVIEVASFDAYPDYESITPVTRCIYQGDDNPSMPFIPFGDDSGFDHVAHMEWYRNLSWQDAFMDPDSTYSIIGRLD